MIALVFIAGLFIGATLGGLFMAMVRTGKREDQQRLEAAYRLADEEYEYAGSSDDE